MTAHFYVFLQMSKWYAACECQVAARVPVHTKSNMGLLSPRTAGMHQKRKECLEMQSPKCSQ
jgi:hypothetical protein